MGVHRLTSWSHEKVRACNDSVLIISQLYPTREAYIVVKCLTQELNHTPPHRGFYTNAPKLATMRPSLREKGIERILGQTLHSRCGLFYVLDTAGRHAEAGECI